VSRIFLLAMVLFPLISSAGDEATPPRPVSCDALDLVSHEKIVGLCTEGVFEGRNLITKSYVRGTCQVPGRVSGRDLQTGAPAQGTCVY
jgi:hypothetical protein